MESPVCSGRLWRQVTRGDEVPEAGVLWINAEFLTFHCYNDTIGWRKTVALFSIHYMSGTIQGKL